MTSYSLNTDEAKEGSGRISTRIEENGPYVGLFTKAKKIKSDGGAVGIEFDFEGMEKHKARFTIYTHGKDGKSIHGIKQLQAIMAILRLKKIDSKMANIKEYSFEAGQEVNNDAEVYPDLMGKPIGIVFQMEEYKGAKGLGRRATFYAPYESSSRKLAIELIDGKPASLLDKMLRRKQWL